MLRREGVFNSPGRCYWMGLPVRPGHHIRVAARSFGPRWAPGLAGVCSTLPGRGYPEVLERWRGIGLWQRLSERSARCTLGQSTIGLDRCPVLCVIGDNCVTFWGDGVAWCKGECARWGGVGCHWTSSVADDLWCETGDPGGSLVSRQKGIPEWETSSAMRSGTGTLRFFYVACDHGRRDAQGRQWGVSHLNCCLSGGEGGPARACRLRQAVSDW
jgi:hypothetical protein